MPTTQHETTNQTRARVPYVAQGAACDESPPDIEGAGVDSVYYAFDETLTDTMWDRLVAEQAIAKTRAAVSPTDHDCPQWLGARLCPLGARGGYHLLIETPNVAIKLLRGTPNRPAIPCHLDGDARLRPAHSPWGGHEGV